MDLLTAVNLILPKLGEHPVTTIHSRSPTLAVLLPIFDRVRRDLLLPGWWFNTHRIDLAYDPNTGSIGMSEDVLSFVADREICSVRGNRLHNSVENTYEWFRTVSGVLISDVPFDELPEVVASLVYASAAVEACVTDLGMTDEVRLWTAQAAEAESRMKSEHLRNMRYSTTKSRRYKSYRRALRG